MGLISPVAWRTPPEHYGPWERFVSLVAEGLVEEGLEVVLFATGNSKTKGLLSPSVPLGYEEDKTLDPKVTEYLHLGHVFEHANEVDILHNNFDFMPLPFAPLMDVPMLTTIHGFSSPKILKVYEKYNGMAYYVAISNADRASALDYEATIHHGIDIESFTFNDRPQDYLLYFGRIHHDKGTKEAIEIAKRAKKTLIIAGIIQDEAYYKRFVKPQLNDNIQYIGSVGPEKRNEILRNAYCLVHPINFREPFGLSIIEAMACGTPVIAYPLGSMPEIITDGETGFLPTNIDEFLDCISKVGTLKRRRCRQEAENRFTSKRMVKEYIKVYDNVLGKWRK